MGVSKHLQKKFTRLEKNTMVVLATVIILCMGALVVWQNQKGTVKPLQGGIFIEGVVGRPQIINPLYVQAGTAEGDITKLVFAGLVNLGPGRDFLPDLAESWEVQNKGKSYTFHLRDDLRWQDGEKLTTDDIVFTIKVIQAEGYSGPFRNDWLAINPVAVDDKTIRFDLPDPSTFFLTKATLGIIPQHMFAHLPVADIGTIQFNSQPVGSGPYRIASMPSGQESFVLESNPYYYQGQALIDKIIFSIFDNEKSMLSALLNGNITAAGFSTSVVENLSDTSGLNKYIYSLPQYKAVFFNQMGGNKALEDVVVRRALALSTDKERIIKEAIGGYGVRADSPILPGFWGHLPDMKKYNFDIAAAADTLVKAGWKDVDNDNIVEKGKIKLSLMLSYKDDKSNTTLANILADNWRKIGAEVNLNPLNSGDLVNQIIRPRNYEALVFGQSMGADSDPYAYWHSSQTADPGLALSVMYDKDIDNPLEMIRLSSDLNRSIGYCHNFQNAFASSVPAVLLYQPIYTYVVDNKVKGTSESINLSSTGDRFMDIHNWYIRSQKTVL